MQTDDTLFVADNEFVEREEKEIRGAKIMAKPRQSLCKETRLEFNGAGITLNENHIARTSKRQGDRLKTIRNQ